MNEVKKCSLSGIAFTMDLDAYKALNDYLETLKKSYKDSPDGAEIVADIEARIAELILNVQDGQRVVALPLIKNIINQMGSAEDILSEEEPTRPKHSTEERLPRRLYRDTEHAKLGGVCSGIGRYFDVDPVWIRLAFFMPLLLGCFSWVPWLHWMESLMGNLFGAFTICYLVMWFAVPAALTARQKLEMTGAKITAQTISENTEQRKTAPDAEARTVVADSVSLAGKVFLILMKLFAGLIVFGLMMVAVALIIGLIAIAVAGHEFTPVDLPLGMPITGIIVVLIPVMTMIYVLMCLIASRKPNGKALIILLIGWLITIIILVTTAIRQHPIIQHSIEEVSSEVVETEIELNDETTTVGELLRRIEEEGELKVNGKVKIKHKAKDKANAPTVGITIEEKSDQSSAEPTKITIKAENDTQAVTIEASDK